MYNIQGQRIKHIKIIEETEKTKTDITVLTETKKNGKCSEVIKDFESICRGVSKEKQAQVEFPQL